jgi:hypothetical protein
MNSYKVTSDAVQIGKHLLGDQVKKTEMGTTCSANGESRRTYRVLVGKLDGMNHLEDPGVDERIILKWIFEKWDGVARTGSMWPRIGTGGGLLLIR